MKYSGHGERMRLIDKGTPMDKAYAYLRYLDKNNLSRAIMNYLEKDSYTVMEMYIKSRTEYHSDICQVLARLRQMGVVSYEESGKEHYYFIVTERWNQVKSAIKGLAE